MHVNYSLSFPSFKKLNISYILYDDSWESIITPQFREYLRDNCTPIAEISQNISLPPNLESTSIKIYKINK